MINPDPIRSQLVADHKRAVLLLANSSPMYRAHWQRTVDAAALAIVVHDKARQRHRAEHFKPIGAGLVTMCLGVVTTGYGFWHPEYGAMAGLGVLLCVMSAATICAAWPAWRALR